MWQYFSKLLDEREREGEVMDNQTACAVMSASETASDFKKSFICANDDLHQSLLDSPLAIFVYVFGVLLLMFIVQRAAKPLPQKNDKED